MKFSIPTALFLTALSALTLSLCSVAAFAGDKTGNGGDICEDRIKIVRDDISSWLNHGGGSLVNLPDGVSPVQYAAAMQSSIRTAQISCTAAHLYVGAAEKACKNFSDSTGQKRIQCNFARLMALSESDQYVLIHHEYAGLAGFETNIGESSQYGISNQISDYLQDTVVKRLAIKSSVTAADESMYGRWVAVRTNEFGTARHEMTISKSSTRFTIHFNSGLFKPSCTASIKVDSVLRGTSVEFLSDGYDSHASGSSTCTAQINGGEVWNFKIFHGRLYSMDASGQIIRAENGDYPYWTRD